MTILIVLALLTIAGFWILKNYSEVLGATLMAISAAPLLAFLLMLPLQRMEIYGQIQQFKSVEATAKVMRDKPNIENAAFQLKIAEMNQWLADNKYWNSTVFDIFIPDEIEKLEPIK
jgi:hypothetical protein